MRFTYSVSLNTCRHQSTPHDVTALRTGRPPQRHHTHTLEQATQGSDLSAYECSLREGKVVVELSGALSRLELHRHDARVHVLAVGERRLADLAHAAVRSTVLGKTEHSVTL